MLRSIVAVTAGPDETRLTTLERVKRELDITEGANDDLLRTKIDEATSDIEAHLSRTLSRATLRETFWSGDGRGEFFILDRAPVAAIDSVTVDDVAVDSDEYRLDANAGLLYRLDANGYPCLWSWCKSVVIEYSAGFLLPGEQGRNLPFALEAGAIDLVNDFWLSRGENSRDLEIEIPGVIRRRRWVGAVGETGELPPNVQMKISPFRRPRA